MELLIDEKSALAHANLRAMILDPEVWKLLTPEQAALVRKYLPNTSSSSSSSQNSNNGGGDVMDEALAALASNDHLRHDIAQYQKELSDGQHDPEWIRQAREANKLRNEAAAAEESENASGSERGAKKKAKDTNGIKTEAKEGRDGDHHMTDA